MDPRLELRMILNEEKKDNMAWRNVLNPHTTNRKDKLINKLDDHFECTSRGKDGFQVRLVLPASFAAGDGLVGGQ